MMDYKEKYEQAISRAKEVLLIAKEMISAMNDIGGAAKVDDVLHILHELSESEDEKIRKDIVAAVETYGDFTQGRKEEIYAWLEKQGEQKLTDKVDPKFKVGDWIVSNTNPNCVNSIMFIADYNNDSRSYLCRYRDGQMEYSYEFIENSYHLWTIQDAKNGDVLVYPDGTIVLFKYRLDGLNSGIYMSHILLATKIETCQSCAILKDLHPATKEQSDLLFQKMKEAGYEWDADNKELKKIEHSCYHNDGLYYAIDILEKTFGEVEGYQSDDGKMEHQAAIETVNALYHKKPVEWSEEDKVMLKDIISGLKAQKSLTFAHDNQGNAQMNARIDWLQSLSEKFVLEPKQEWSEEDESHIGRILSYLESFKAYNAPHIEPIKKEIDWLKSIKPNLWKPSEEQKSVAERFARIVRGNLIGIDKDVQQKFEQLYFEVTGNKMYGGYND